MIMKNGDDYRTKEQAVMIATSLCAMLRDAILENDTDKPNPFINDQDDDEIELNSYLNKHYNWNDNLQSVRGKFFTLLQNAAGTYLKPENVDQTQLHEKGKASLRFKELAFNYLQTFDTSSSVMVEIDSKEGRYLVSNEKVASRITFGDDKKIKLETGQGQCYLIAQIKALCLPYDARLV